MSVADEHSGLNTNSAILLKRKTIHSVQLMRGLAAIAVVLYHTNLILSQPEYGANDSLAWLSSRGWMGVNFFFVLSGFIILLAHRGDLGRKETILRYFWRRFVRVYPVYWIFLTAYIIGAAAGLGHADFSWDALNLLSGYTLYGFVDAPSFPLKVAWTLVYEVRFYLLFAVLLFSRRLGIALFTAWGLFMVLYAVIDPSEHIAVLDMWNIYFLLGMATCLACDGIEPRHGWWLALGGALMVIVLSRFAGDRIGESEQNALLLLLTALAFAVLLLGVVLVEAKTSWVPPAWLSLLGDSSYSIYLVHSAVLSAIAQFYSKFFPDALSFPVVFLGSFSTAVISGVVAHLLIELPILSTVRNWSRKYKAGHTT